MKILYVSQFFNPERAAAAFRAFDNSRLWVNKDHKVTVLTGYPNFPTGKIFEGYECKLLSEEIIDGVKVLRSKIIIKENTNKIKRAVSALSFMFFGLWNIIFNEKKIGKEYDVVLGTSGTIFSPIIAYVYSALYKTPFVLEIRDITYRQILAVYSGEEKFLYKLVKKLELFLCKKANKVVVVTNGFKSQLIKDGICKDKIEVIPNGVSLDKINYGYSEFNKDKSEFILSYMGNLGESQNLTGIVDFFYNLNIENRKKKLIFIGEGSKKQEIKEYVIKNNVDNVIILDGMEKEKLEKYYEMSDFCIVSLKNNEYFKDTLPSKLFEIMARKRPILYFGPDGEAASIIKESKSGIICCNNIISENILLFKDAIKMKNYDMGNNGFEYLIKNHDREGLALKYLNLIKDVCDEENR